MVLVLVSWYLQFRAKLARKIGGQVATSDEKLTFFRKVFTLNWLTKRIHNDKKM